MFERFTDRARKVMALANQQAQRLNHKYIETEDILWGLVLEGGGVGATVLKSLDVDLTNVLAEVDKLIRPVSKPVAGVKLPHAAQAKRVIEAAAEESQRLGHNYVGTEHLLLGLLHERDGIAARVLMVFGLDLDQVRDQVLSFLGGGPEQTFEHSVFVDLQAATHLIADQLMIQLTLVGKLIEDLHGDDLIATPAGQGGNHALWILGHLAWAEERLIVCFANGRDHPHPQWEAQFGMGALPVADAGKYPSKDELWDRWRRVRTNTLQTLADFDDAGLAARSFAKDADHLATIDNCFMAAVTHTAFHCGQLADIRRALGRKPVFG
jgi:hypothetical protein